MRGLSCRRIQVDEIWTYVAKKQRQVKEGMTLARRRPVDVRGARSLTRSWSRPTASASATADRYAFLNDLSERLANRVQLSSDALAAYVEAIEQAFGADVDYGQVVKVYEAEPIGPGRYSPPRVVSAERTVITGSPDPRPHLDQLR